MMRAWLQRLLHRDRPEALAACALAIGARLEPVAALRRLAAEDPSLRVLAAVADRVAAGVALPEALARERLLTPRDAASIHGLPPETLSQALGQFAQRAESVPLGERLARWLPVWAVLAATVPSLAIGAAVALASGTAWGGLMLEFGYRTVPVGPVAAWSCQIAGIALAVTVVVLDWKILQALPFLRATTWFSLRLVRAAAFEDLLRRLRSGGDGIDHYEQWARVTGRRAELRRHLDASAGDATAALLAAGAIPRHADSRPDWETATQEAAKERSEASAAIAPWLAAVLVACGILGFVSWAGGPLAGLSISIHQHLKGVSAGWPVEMSEIAGAAVQGVIIAAAAVVITHVLSSLRATLALLAGPAPDWPLVADRLARAIERRDELGTALRGLRAVTRPQMRERIDAALDDDDPHVGARLARAGMAPATIAPVLTRADLRDLPALLRCSAERMDSKGARAALSQMILVGMLASVVALQQGLLQAPYLRRLKYKEDAMAGADLPMQLVEVGGALALVLLAAGIALAVAAMLGSRYGWWLVLGGWRRRARGLVLRRAMARSATEVEIATELGALLPAAAKGIDSAGARGDIAELIHGCGWNARTADELDTALAADLVARDRRHARVATGMRLALPVFLAVPVGLTAAGVTMITMGISGALRDRVPLGGPAFSPTIGAFMLQRWQHERADAVAEEVLDLERPLPAPRRGPAAKDSP